MDNEWLLISADLLLILHSSLLAFVVLGDQPELNKSENWLATLKDARHPMDTGLGISKPKPRLEEMLVTI